MAFWYLSIGGAVGLLAYAIHRRDPVFILGQSGGFLVYLRNLHLIRRERRRAAAGHVKERHFPEACRFTPLDQAHGEEIDGIREAFRRNGSYSLRLESLLTPDHEKGPLAYKDLAGIGHLLDASGGTDGIALEFALRGFGDLSQVQAYSER